MVNIRFEDFNDAAQYLANIDDSFDINNTTNGKIIDHFINIGHKEEVYAFNDDVHQLDSVSDEIRNSNPQDDLDLSSNEVLNIIDVIEGIARYNERELSEEDLEEIEEDQKRRGIKIE